MQGLLYRRRRLYTREKREEVGSRREEESLKMKYLPLANVKCASHMKYRFAM
jgi:hypothetical protein